MLNVDLQAVAFPVGILQESRLNVKHIGLRQLLWKPIGQM